MRALRLLKVVLLVIVASVLLGLVVEHLWNWLMPTIFGLKTIGYWQAVGLLLLSKILLGGFHKHGGRGGRHWRGKMQERWAAMSPEERERFRAGMKGRCGGFGGRGWRRGGWAEEGREETHEREAERG
jgi:hypothetical protein